MHSEFQLQSLEITRKLMRLFYVEEDIEGVLAHFNRERFTFIGMGENEIFTSFDEVRDYYYRMCKTVASSYKIISEDYQLGGASEDSCVVVAKIGFQGNALRLNYQVTMHFSFYYQLVDGRPLVSMYHTHFPSKSEEKVHVEDFLPAVSEPLHADFQLQQEILNQFGDTSHIAAKSVLYKDGLPYCYVNNLFLELVGCKKISSANFPENSSSLAHIHVDDQRRYFEYLRKIFDEKNAAVSEGWQWHNHYCVMYRLINLSGEEREVLEWGNFLSLNGKFLINSFVTPVEEAEILTPSPVRNFFNLEEHSEEISALLDDCGIYVGNILLIYPRRRKIFVKGKEVFLTPIEFELLLGLTANLNQPLTASEIYKNLWDSEELKVTSFTLKTHISNLRRKLRAASDEKIQLTNVKGQGYCLSVAE